MSELSAEMKALEDSMAVARSKLSAQTDKIEAQLREKFDLALQGLNISVGAAMTQSRAAVESKMSSDMTGLRTQITSANAASLASAKQLHEKVAQVEAAAAAAAAASKAQVAGVEKDHAAFEAHAATTLAHVQDSLAHTKVLSPLRFHHFVTL